MFWGTAGGRTPVLDLDFVGAAAAAVAAGADGEVASDGLALV